MLENKLGTKKRGRWKDGESGNPGGRPKQYAELKALCRQYTEEAVNALVDVLRTGAPRERVIAANALLDRGYGKPEQSIDVSGEVTKFVIRAPAQALAVEEWKTRHRPETKNPKIQ